VNAENVPLHQIHRSEGFYATRARPRQSSVNDALLHWLLFLNKSLFQKTLEMASVALTATKTASNECRTYNCPCSACIVEFYL